MTPVILKQPDEEENAYLKAAFNEAAEEMAQLFAEHKDRKLPWNWLPTPQDRRLKELWTHFYLCIIDTRGGEAMLAELAQQRRRIEHLEARVLDLEQKLRAGVKPAVALEVRL